MEIQMANRFKVEIEGENRKTYPFTEDMLQVGTIYETATLPHGKFFLRTYDGVVCLDDPQHTWPANRGNLIGINFRMLPEGSVVKLKVHK